MGNMDIYNAFKNTPKEAQSQIKAGRLKGFTNINPMWRMKRLTEMFGPCGFGWWYEITDKQIVKTESGEAGAFVSVNLYVVVDGNVSRPIPGEGGSTYIAKEKNGLHVDDECYKKALTDAISIACKALGMSADIWFNEERDNKYVFPKAEENPIPKNSSHTNTEPMPKCADCDDEISIKVHDYSVSQFGRPLCMDCQKKARG